MPADVKIPERIVANHPVDFFAAGHKLTETLVLLGGLKGTDSVLDIGCGPCRVAIGIGSRFAWVNAYLGFDVIASDVEIGATAITPEHPTFQFKHLDVFNGRYNPMGKIAPDKVDFPCQANSVDLAFAFSVFTHLRMADSQRYIQEAFRCLKSGGRFLSTWFVIDGPAEAQIHAKNSRFTFPFKAADGGRYEKQKQPEECMGFNFDDMARMFAEAGFVDMAFHPGAWSRAERERRPRHSQDTVVWHKP